VSVFRRSRRLTGHAAWSRAAAASAAALALAALGGVARANNLGEDGAWQFQTPAQVQIQQQNLALVQAHNHPTQAAPTLNGSGFGTGGSGLLFASNQPTNNYTQVVNQTTISCSGAGTVCSASGGGNTTSVTATSTGSTTSNTNNVTGNTVDQNAYSNNNGSNNNNPVLTPTTTNNGTQTNATQNNNLAGSGI